MFDPISWHRGESWRTSRCLVFYVSPQSRLKQRRKHQKTMSRPWWSVSTWWFINEFAKYFQHALFIRLSAVNNEAFLKFRCGRVFSWPDICWISSSCSQLSCWCKLFQHQRIIRLHVSYGVLWRWSSVFRLVIQQCHDHRHLSMPLHSNWFCLTSSSFLSTKDFNECDPSGLSSEYQHLAHICHDDANCTNTKGSYYCGCLNGYSGLGEYCTGIVLGILALNGDVSWKENAKRINNGQ